MTKENKDSLNPAVVKKRIFQLLATDPKSLSAKAQEVFDRIHAHFSFVDWRKCPTASTDSYEKFVSRFISVCGDVGSFSGKIGGPIVDHNDGYFNFPFTILNREAGKLESTNLSIEYNRGVAIPELFPVVVIIRSENVSSLRAEDVKMSICVDSRRSKYVRADILPLLTEFVRVCKLRKISDGDIIQEFNKFLEEYGDDETRCEVVDQRGVTEPIRPDQCAAFSAIDDIVVSYDTRHEVASRSIAVFQTLVGTSYEKVSLKALHQAIVFIKSTVNTVSNALMTSQVKEEELGEKLWELNTVDLSVLCDDQYMLVGLIHRAAIDMLYCPYLVFKNPAGKKLILLVRQANNDEERGFIIASRIVSKIEGIPFE